VLSSQRGLEYSAVFHVKHAPHLIAGTVRAPDKDAPRIVGAMRGAVRCQ